MVDLITLSLVKYSDGNIATYQLHFVNSGDLNGYTKAISVTMMAIIIVLQSGVCKSRMAHNYWLAAINVLQFMRKMNCENQQVIFLKLTANVSRLCFVADNVNEVIKILPTYFPLKK